VPAHAVGTALEALLGSPSERAALREQGLRRAAGFTWARTAERVDALLGDVVSAGGAGPRS
jgi:hypothetical protein